MRNIKIIAPSKDFPAAGKRHALRGKLSSRWKTPRAPQETFQPLENATRSAGNFPAAGKRHALRGKLSSRWKTPCAPREAFATCETATPREAFATCETATRSAGSFRNLRNGHALRGKLSQLAKWPRAPREAFATCEKASSPEAHFSQPAKNGELWASDSSWAFAYSS